MTQTDLRSWSRLWRELSAEGDPAPWHARLIAAYAEPSRAYHNLQHLEECLAELEASRRLAQRPEIVATALWFHDAVYDPRSGKNEEDSAVLAVECLTSAGVAAATVDVVRQLILCTKSHEPGDLMDGALLIDIDLAILGQAPSRFWSYERGIKAEYAWVPDALYREKRAEILQRFLQRPGIYRTDSFHTRYESAARENFRAAIARLNEKPS